MMSPIIRSHPHTSPTSVIPAHPSTTQAAPSTPSAFVSREPAVARADSRGLAATALLAHTCGGRRRPCARLMKWPGMSPRLRRTAGHTIAMRDAVVVRSSVQLGQMSASVVQRPCGMTTKMTWRHETNTIGVDDGLRRSTSLDSLSVNPRPAAPPHRLLPTFIILPLVPSIPIGVIVNSPTGTRQEIGVRAKPERTAPVGTPIGLIAPCPLRAAVGVVAKFGTKDTSATSTPPPLLLRPSPSSSVEGSINELEGESASSSAAVDVFAEPASNANPKTPTSALGDLHIGGVDVSANLDATNHDETPTPPRGPLPFAPPARGSPAPSRGPSCKLMSSMMSTGILAVKMSGAGPHTPVDSDQPDAGGQ